MMSNQMYYLLIESPTAKIRSTTVSTNKVIFEAVLHTADTPNKNGRIYPLEVMKEAVVHIKPKLRERTFGGELDHPLPNSDEYGSTLRHITMSLKEMSHVFTDLWFEGNKLVGKGETLSTPNGRILAGLLHDGVQVGFSIRAFTDNLRRHGEYEYVEGPVSLIGVDAVATPSHSEAKIRTIKLSEEEMKQLSNKQHAVSMLLESYLKLKQKRWFFFGAPLVYEF